MKAICIHDCQFRGVLVKADTVLDITADEFKVSPCKSSFRPLGGDVPKPKAEDATDESGMTAADYRARLDVMNVPYHPTDTIDELRKLFDRANDQTARKGSRA